VLVPAEVKYLAQCQHIDGVIPMLDWYFYNAGYCIVMPLLDDMCVASAFVKSYSPNENSKRIIAKQLVQILIDCKKANVYHFR